MALPSPSASFVPALFVVVDPASRVTGFDAPDGLRDALLTAVRSKRRVDTLSWAAPRAVRRAVSRALCGQRYEFSGWRLGDFVFDGAVFPLESAGGAVAIAANDYSELYELRQALVQSEEFTLSAYFVLEPRDSMVNVTPAFATLWGFDEATARIAFAELAERVDPSDRAAFLRDHLQCEPGAHVSGTYRVAHPHRGTRYLRTNASHVSGNGRDDERCVGIVTDVTEHVLARESAEFLERHDALTRLWNRQHFITQLESLPSDVTGALAIIDLDRFAQVNEVQGHAAGDAVLRTIADRMRFLERLGHWAARLGGDEFACFIFERDGSRDDERIVESLHQRLEVPFAVGERYWSVRTTIGYARAPYDASNVALLQNADMALISAKASARGSVVRYHPTLEQRVLTRGRLEADLSHAIEREEFEMFYQPVIDAKSGRVVATEALLRWNHPSLGMLLPSSFLNVAEESDHVVNIGRWSMERACRDAVTIANELGRPLRLNVNVSPRHVQSTALVADVAAALARTGWPATLLQLEVTEQLLIEDVPAAAMTLSSLRENGVSVAIDDFGTGYNTLSYLKSYPVSCLKIDRAFVRDAESDDYSRAICRSVTALAESLDMSLIGEGVETDGQARFLEAIGCQELQGFHFGRPVNVEHFIARYR